VAVHEDVEELLGEGQVSFWRGVLGRTQKFCPHLFVPEAIANFPCPQGLFVTQRGQLTVITQNRGTPVVERSVLVTRRCKIENN